MFDAVIRLPDGRSLAYLDNGRTEGLPVVHFHGSPSSRLEGRTFARWIEDLPIRLIAVDRPGFGGSDRKAERTLTEWPDDVAALADALGIGGFAVSALSAGGPSAAATAWKLGERVRAVVVVSGLGPVIDNPAINDGNEARQARARSAIQTPDTVRSDYEALAALVGDDPAGIAGALLAAMAPADRALIAANASEDGFTEALAEAMRPGGTGVGDDDVVNNGLPWGFDAAEISCPYDLWHGDADTTIPIAHAQLLAKRIPHARLHTVDAGGHFIAYQLRAQPFEALLARLGRVDAV